MYIILGDVEVIFHYQCCLVKRFNELANGRYYQELLRTQ